MQPTEARPGAEANVAGIVVHGLREEPAAIVLCSRGVDSLLVIDEAEVRRYVVFADGSRRESVSPRPPRSVVRFCSAHRDAYLVASIDARAPTRDVVTIDRLDPAGPVVTGRVESNDSGRITTLRRSFDSVGVLLAYSGPEGPVRIERVDASRAMPIRTEIPSSDVADGLSREVVGAYLGDAGIVVLFRRGAPEDDRGGVVMVTERGARTLEPLQELALLEVLIREEREVVLVGSFEFDRPHAFRFGLDGTSLESRRILPGETPAFVPDRTRADVDADATGIELRIRDAGGDVLRSVHVPRAEGRTPPALARDGRDFLIATTDTVRDGWGVRVVRTNAEVISR